VSAAVFNRRAALAGAASAAAVMAVAGAAVAASLPAAGVSADLGALIAESDRLDRLATYHYEHVWKPLRNRVEAAVAALPHTTIEHGEAVGGGPVIWSTAKPNSVSVTRAIVEMAKEGKDMKPAGLPHARALQAAHLRRQRAIARIHRESGWNKENERSDAMSEPWADAQDAVGAFLVRNATDLHAKVAFMVKHQMFDGRDWSAEMLADAAHLAKLEG
jgi:hypothetical protein